MGEFSRLNGRYNPVKTALFALTFILGCLLLPLPSTAEASTFDTEVRIRIVPLECIIEEINNGISEEYFLGPTECEDLINPPIITPPEHVPPDTSSGSSNGQPATTAGRENQVFLTPVTGQSEASDPDRTNPAIKQPLIKLGDYKFLTTTLSKIGFFLFLVVSVLLLILNMVSGRRVSLANIFGVWWRR